MAIDNKAGMAEWGDIKTSSRVMLHSSVPRREEKKYFLNKEFLWHLQDHSMHINIQHTQTGTDTHSKACRLAKLKLDYYYLIFEN